MACGDGGFLGRTGVENLDHGKALQMQKGIKTAKGFVCLGFDALPENLSLIRQVRVNRTCIMHPAPTFLRQRYP